MIEENKLPCIYKATSKTTGKSYIGQSRPGLDWRMKQHLNKAFNKDKDKRNYTEFAKALRKYGKDDFEWSILETVENLTGEDLVDKLNQLEMQYIAEYDSFNNGYNMSSGGEGATKYKYATLKEKLAVKRLELPIRQAIRETLDPNKKIRRRTIHREYMETYKVKAYEKRKEEELKNPALKEYRLKQHREYMKANRQKQNERKRLKRQDPEYRAHVREMQRLARAKRNGTDPRGERAGKKEDLLPKIIELSNQGISKKKIAEQLNINRATVRKWLSN